MSFFTFRNLCFIIQNPVLVGNKCKIYLLSDSYERLPSLNFLEAFFILLKSSDIPKQVVF